MKYWGINKNTIISCINSLKDTSSCTTNKTYSQGYPSSPTKIPIFPSTSQPNYSYATRNISSKPSMCALSAPSNAPDESEKDCLCLSPATGLSTAAPMWSNCTPSRSLWSRIRQVWLCPNPNSTPDCISWCTHSSPRPTSSPWQPHCPPRISPSSHQSHSSMSSALYSAISWIYFSDFHRQNPSRPSTPDVWTKVYNNAVYSHIIWKLSELKELNLSSSLRFFYCSPSCSVHNLLWNWLNLKCGFYDFCSASPPALPSDLMMCF